jgi:hypothetical protein
LAFFMDVSQLAGMVSGKPIYFQLLGTQLRFNWLN